MDGLRHTWNAVADLNPLSLPAISKEGMENKEKEGMENSGGASIFYIFLQIIFESNQVYTIEKGISTTNWDSGVYFLTVIFENKKVIKKIIKE